MPSKARALPNAIVIVGGGQVGLAAALALRRALPRTDVTIVPCKPDASALADRATTSMPRTSTFHERLGLDEDGFILRAGASHRLGVRFVNWHQQDGTYIHAYGASSAEGDSVSQYLAGANRFAHPADDRASPLSDIDYAMRYEPSSYKSRLGSLASHLGVQKRDAPIAVALPDGHGGIAQIKLTSGETMTADLYVDCTGPQALLTRAALLVPFHSWSDRLPCNRMLLAPIAQPPSITVTDIIETHQAGWMSSNFGREGTHHALVCNADFWTEMAIANELDRSPDEVIAFEAGRLEQSWVGNVVAFGDAAAVFEPLHWLNLALAHEQILLFLELLPGADICPLERAEYNRRASVMADRVRDFIALHYCMPSPPKGMFWQHAAKMKRSAGLTRTIREFVKRGRLPFFEEDIMSRDAWHSAFASIGITPGRSALSLAAPEQTVAERMGWQHRRATSAYEQAQPYPVWLKQFIESKI